MFRLRIKRGNGQRWLAILTFSSLLMLIFIQVSWILKAARLEEKNFNYQVSKAMNSVREELGKRASGCNQMNNYLCGKTCPSSIHEVKLKEIDSIVQSQLDNYNIELEYKLAIGDSLVEAASKKSCKSKCYLQSLNGLIEKDGIRLCIQFPSRNQFLLAQMKGWFIMAILFIIIVATSFLMMMRLFLREKVMLVQTGDFINNMVHEFQTPLANIKLASSLIQKKLGSDQNTKVSEYTSVIQKESQKMELNVVRILDISSRNGEEHQTENISIHDCIQCVIDQYQYRINEIRADVKTDFKAIQYQIHADEEQIRLMFSNLIDNALKYSNENPVILFETFNFKNDLIILVKDNGIGIAKKDQPYIFDQYYRVSTGNVHNVKGFGLGLTYVKKIAELYKGSIELSSMPGQGSEFKIVIPLK